VVSTVLPGARSEIMWAPGATTSGLGSWSAAVGPRALKSGSQSSPRDAVPRSSVAPTVITQGSSPGLEIVPGAGPRLLAATTTAIPASQARWTA
jgi:hypothetical protein